MARDYRKGIDHNSKHETLFERIGRSRWHIRSKMNRAPTLMMYPAGVSCWSGLHWTEVTWLKITSLSEMKGK